MTDCTSTLGSTGQRAPQPSDSALAGVPRTSYLTTTMHHFYRFALTLSLLLSAAAQAGTPLRHEALAQIARQSLSANIVSLQSGSYLQAGQHQFKSIWVRDFCWSVRGLLALGRADVVHDTLRLILQNIRQTDAMVPRLLDNRSIEQRYVLKTFKIYPKLHDPLHPEFNGGNRSRLAIDGAANVVIATLLYTRATGDQSLWLEFATSLSRLVHFYDGWLTDGLVWQPPYSDWQDNVRREGHTYYTNVVYWTMLHLLAAEGKLGVTTSAVDALHGRIAAAFFDGLTGLYRSIEGYPYVSMDGLAIGVDFGFDPLDSPAGRAIYSRLKQSPLWNSYDGLPGLFTFPDYPKNWSAWIVNLGGLQHYSDDIYSSTLIAWSAKVASLMGDSSEAARIMDRLQALAQRDHTINEIYAPTGDHRPVKTALTRSEAPFSWGAATVLDTLKTMGEF